MTRDNTINDEMEFGRALKGMKNFTESHSELTRKFIASDVDENDVDEENERK